eukprot:10686110-Ditylum_brightwellii.AAC.1
MIITSSKPVMPSDASPGALIQRLEQALSSQQAFFEKRLADMQRSHDNLHSFVYQSSHDPNASDPTMSPRSSFSSAPINDQMSNTYVDSIIDCFPHRFIYKHYGMPTFKTIHAVHEVLNENALSVASTLGGGQHGHLGLVISKQLYLTLTGHHFVEPTSPGSNATIPPGILSPVHIDKIVRSHTEAKRIWLDYNATDKALQKQLLNSFEDTYFEAKKDKNSDFLGISTKELLDHLYFTYAQLTPEQLAENDDNMMMPFGKPFDAFLPIEELFVWIEDAMKIADAGGQPYSVDAVILKSCSIVRSTSAYNTALEKWNKRPKAEQTWPNFKQHFKKACSDLKTHNKKFSDVFEENITKKVLGLDQPMEEQHLKRNPFGSRIKAVIAKVIDNQINVQVKKKIKKFRVIKIAQLLCVIYILVLTFSKAPLGLVDGETGNIIDVSSPENTDNGVIFVNGDYRAVVAEGTLQ